MSLTKNMDIYEVYSGTSRIHQAARGSLRKTVEKWKHKHAKHKLYMVEKAIILAPVNVAFLRPVLRFLGTFSAQAAL